jgi:hypothetical protein
MEDWQRMQLYTESRLEDLHAQAKAVKLLAGKNPSMGRAVVLFTALLLGLAIWWIF